METEVEASAGGFFVYLEADLKRRGDVQARGVLERVPRRAAA
jgi:hypothetical protein